MSAEQRAETHRDLIEYFRELRGKYPKLRSIMMGVAQYWADEADDAVHAHCIASERDTPVWPHACDVDYDAAEGRDGSDGERCWNCAEDFGWMPFDDNGGAIEAFEPWCHEEGSQEEPSARNYRPYAIARVGANDEITVEVVGRPYRPSQVMMPATEEGLAWPTPRAAELFAEVCAHPADDAPRHVLADHLLEVGDPRGEYLSLALGGGALPDPDPRWFHPLAAVIPEGGARFERGFLAHVDVHCPDDATADLVRGASAWRTVASIHYHGDSAHVLDEEMVALRSVGTCYHPDLETIAAASRPWAIEELRVYVANLEIAARLATIKTLPHLRQLTLVGAGVASAFPLLASAPFWPQLTLVRVLAEDVDRPVAIPAAITALPRFALGTADEHADPVGWDLVYDQTERTLTVAHVGWSPSATIAELGARKVPMPDGPVRLRSSRTFQATQADADALGALWERPVVLA